MERFYHRAPSPESTIEVICRNVLELVASMEDCLAKERILPCLILLYCGIDIIASLEDKAPKVRGEKLPTRSPAMATASRHSFERWVNRYLLKAGHFSFSARDLYSARCGIIHSYSPESDLYRSGRARIICYAYGPDTLQDLEERNRREVEMGFQRTVGAHVRDLITGYRNAFANYIEDVQNDSARMRTIVEATKVWFFDKKDGLGVLSEDARPQNGHSRKQIEVPMSIAAER